MAIKKDFKALLLATALGMSVFHGTVLLATKRSLSEAIKDESDKGPVFKKLKSNVQDPSLFMNSEKDLRDGILSLLKDSDEGDAQYKQVISGLYGHVFDLFKEKLTDDNDRLALLAGMRKDFDTTVELDEISHDQLHYHTMQLMILLKSDFDVGIPLFLSLEKFRSLPDDFLIIPHLPEGSKTPWKLSYANGLKLAETIESTLEAQKLLGVTDFGGTSIDELIGDAKDFRTNIYTISDRGFKVFPFFHEKPIFELETYLRLFAEGAYLVAAPLAQCSVHSGLIEDPATVSFHDVLHLQNVAPGKTKEENQVHVKRMRRIVSKMLQVFDQRELSVEDRHKSIAGLFAVTHELASYYGGEVLFNDSMTDAEVFQAMLSVAEADVTKTFFGKDTDTKLDFYKAYAANFSTINVSSIVSVTDDGVYIPQVGAPVLDVHTVVEYFDASNSSLGMITSDDVLSLFENKRKFGYQIAWLLKYAGMRPDLTFKNFKFSDGYNGFNELLGWFKETYEDVLSAASEKKTGEIDSKEEITTTTTL